MDDALTLALAWGGPVVAALAWAAIRRGGSIWVVMGLALGPLGVLALLTGRVEAVEDVGLATAIGAGAGAGLALYGATAAFMYTVRRWPVLARQARTLYDQRHGLPVRAALAIAVLVVAPGEEALWRGLVQPVVADRIGDLAGAAAVLGAYLAANAFSLSVPIVLGAGVGGAAWGGLAYWSGGVMAGMLCHMTWTGLMIVAPPLFSDEPGGR